MVALFIPAGESRLPLGPDALEVTGQAGVGDVHRGGVRLGVLGGTDIVSAVAILATDGDGRVSVMGPAVDAVADLGGGLLMAGSASGPPGVGGGRRPRGAPAPAGGQAAGTHREASSGFESSPAADEGRNEKDEGQGGQDEEGPDQELLAIEGGARAARALVA